MLRYVVGALLIAFVAFAVYNRIFTSPGPLPRSADESLSTVHDPTTWYTAHGGLAGLRRSQAPASIEGAIAWRQQVGERPITQLIADDERLYLSFADGTLRAFARDDGLELWRRSYEQAPLATPSLAGDRLFVARASGSLEAINASTGTVLWQAASSDAVLSSPLVRDGIVYVFGRGEWLGFEAETGNLLWRLSIDADSSVEREPLSPVVGEDYIAVAVGERLLIFDRDTGEETYWYDFMSQPDAVALGGDTLYALSHRVFVSLQVDSRRPWWDGVRRAWVQLYVWGLAPDVPPAPRNWLRLDPPRGPFHPAVGDEYVYISSEQGSVLAYSKEGAILWSREIGRGTAPPTLASNGLLVPTERALFLLDPRSGRTVAQRDVGGAVNSSVVVVDGTFVALVDGTILALR